MTQNKEEHVPTYRNTNGGEPGEGPMTRRERLSAWWDYGEFEHPKKVSGAVSVGVLLAVMPFTWQSALILVGLPTLMAVCVLVLLGPIAVVLHAGFSSSEKRGWRKLMLLSGVTFVIGFPAIIVMNPYGLAETAASDAAEEEKNRQEFDRRCREHFFLQEMPLPQASCPTNDGTC